MQENILSKGDIAVGDDGSVVVVTRTNVRSETLDNAGRVHTYHTGTVLRSKNMLVGSRYAGKVLRSVCPVEKLLSFAEQTGLDLTTPAEPPDSQLTTVEILQKQIGILQKQVQALSTDDADLPAVPA
jgi:hypothetical protein